MWESLGAEKAEGRGLTGLNLNSRSKCSSPTMWEKRSWYGMGCNFKIWPKMFFLGKPNKILEIILMGIIITHPYSTKNSLARKNIFNKKREFFQHDNARAHVAH